MKVLEKITEYGLYLFVFLLPWQTRLILREGNLNGYWEYGTISIYATEILLWAIFLLTGIAWTIGKLKAQNSKLKITAQSSKLFYLIILFLVFYSLTLILWAGSRGLALYAWHWLAEGVGLFLVLRAVKFDVAKLMWAFVMSAGLQAGIGIWQFLSQETFSSKWLGMALHDPAVPGIFVVETAFRRWLRAYGSLPHPNMLAGFLAAAMFFTIWLYQKTVKSFKKILLPAIFVILSFGLFATFSKSVILGFSAAMILWLAGFFIFKKSREEKNYLLKFILIFIVVAAVFSVIFWEPVGTRIYGAERLEIKSTAERLNYFDQAWQLIKNHPVLGVGLGNYTLAVHNEINPNLRAWDYQPVHNIYLLILAELGIMGLLLWLVLLFFIIKQLPIAHYPLLITILAIGLFDHYLWTLYFGVILFWLILGMEKKNLDEPLDRS